MDKDKHEVVALADNRKYARAMVWKDRCPKCYGHLDTGWECHACGFDAQPIADTMNLDENPNG